MAERSFAKEVRKLKLGEGEEFVGEGMPWAHVDIAGPAFNDKGPKGHTPKGGTGFGVATLLALVESSAG